MLMVMVPAASPLLAVGASFLQLIQLLPTVLELSLSVASASVLRDRT